MLNNDCLEQESAILEVFEQLKNPNDKKVKKLAAKLYNEVTNEIQKRLCRQLPLPKGRGLCR